MLGQPLIELQRGACVLLRTQYRPRTPWTHCQHQCAADSGQQGTEKHQHATHGYHVKYAVRDFGNRNRCDEGAGSVEQVGGERHGISKDKC
jgi:hypothetical protein